MDKELLFVKSRIEDCLVSVTWTHKIHEKQADLFDERNKTVTLVSCLLAALTGSGALSMLGIGEQWLKWATAALALSSLFLFIYSAAFDYSNKANEHRQAAKVFLAIREEARSLLTLLAIGELDAFSALSSVNVLFDKYSVACFLAPQTTDKAVAAAEAALGKGESTVTEKERELFCDRMKGDS